MNQIQQIENLSVGDRFYACTSTGLMRPGGWLFSRAKVILEDGKKIGVWCRDVRNYYISEDENMTRAMACNQATQDGIGPIVNRMRKF
jgi:hypothetical protein